MKAITLVLCAASILMLYPSVNYASTTLTCNGHNDSEHQDIVAIGRVWEYWALYGWVQTYDVGCCIKYNSGYSLEQEDTRSDPNITISSSLQSGDDVLFTSYSYYQCGEGASDPILVPLANSSPWNNIVLDINGGPGSDVISGAWANDIILGGDDDDYIMSGPGDDYIEGNEGWDYMWGQLGSDEIYGSDYSCATYDGWSDWIDGGPGNDIMHGCDGWCDWIVGDSANDDCNGNEGSYDWCDCHNIGLGCDTPNFYTCSYE